VFAHFLALRIVQTMLERKGFELESWIEPSLSLKTIQKHFQIDPRVDETVILNDLESYGGLSQGWGDKNESLEHTLEVYYTLAVYLRLPQLLGINEKAVKKVQNHLSMKLDGVPKRILIQITALYHNMGIQTPPIGDLKGISTSKYDFIEGSVFQETIGSKLGLTSCQILYVTTLLEAFIQLKFNLDTQHLDRFRKTMGVDFPDLVLLVNTDQVVSSRTTALIHNHFARIFEQFFESCKDPDL